MIVCKHGVAEHSDHLLKLDLRFWEHEMALFLESFSLHASLLCFVTGNNKINNAPHILVQQIQNSHRDIYIRMVTPKAAQYQGQVRVVKRLGPLRIDGEKLPAILLHHGL